MQNKIQGFILPGTDRKIQLTFPNKIPKAIVVKKKQSNEVKYANTAAAVGNLQLLQTFERSYPPTLPNVDGANGAAEMGQIQTLEWLSQRGILPNVDGANLAAGNWQKPTLIWLSTRNIWPDSHGATLAERNGDLSTVMWLAQSGISPTVENYF